MSSRGFLLSQNVQILYWGVLDSWLPVEVYHQLNWYLWSVFHLKGNLTLGAVSDLSELKYLREDLYIGKGRHSRNSQSYFLWPSNIYANLKIREFLLLLSVKSHLKYLLRIRHDFTPQRFDVNARGKFLFVNLKHSVGPDVFIVHSKGHRLLLANGDYPKIDQLRGYLAYSILNWTWNLNLSLCPVLYLKSNLGLIFLTQGIIVYWDILLTASLQLSFGLLNTKGVLVRGGKPPFSSTISLVLNEQFLSAEHLQGIVFEKEVDLFPGYIQLNWDYHGHDLQIEEVLIVDNVSNALLDLLHFEGLNC